jgi:hypothetical protein
VFADFVDSANIWMIQSRSSLRLKIETAQRLRACRELVRKKLHGNEAMELGVLRFINDAHATAAELFPDTVMRDGLAGERGREPHQALILGLAVRQVNKAKALTC